VLSQLPVIRRLPRGKRPVGSGSVGRLPISLLVGEMPGRAEGGSKPSERTELLPALSLTGLGDGDSRALVLMAA
jgi:hypothetical protein